MDRQYPPSREWDVTPSILNVCPRSSDPFYIVTSYIIWVTTSCEKVILCNYNPIDKNFFIK